MKVVIPSKNISNLVLCLDSLFQSEPDSEVYIVDDGITDHQPLLKYGNKVQLVCGQKPFVHSRNSNIGLKKAFDIKMVSTITHGNLDSPPICVPRSNDWGVVLMGDDVKVFTPNAFSQLLGCVDDGVGLVSPVTNCIGNPNQLGRPIPIHDSVIIEEPRMLCFVCVMFTRAAIEQVGLLDERFTCYSHNDDDYCHRIRQAKLRMRIYTGVFVDHVQIPSEFRRFPQDLSIGEKIFTDKWGVNPRHAA